MALKIWLIRKIEKIELELKYLKALEIMLEHVEKSNDYSDSNSNSDSDDDEDQDNDADQFSDDDNDDYR